MKKSTNMSTKRIMSTRKPKYIRPSTWANTGATDEIQTREYWLPNPNQPNPSRYTIAPELGFYPWAGLHKTP